MWNMEKYAHNATYVMRENAHICNLNAWDNPEMIAKDITKIADQNFILFALISAHQFNATQNFNQFNKLHRALDYVKFFE